MQLRFVAFADAAIAWQDLVSASCGAWGAGSAVNGLTAVFDVAGSPAWLKAVVLKFALVARLLPGALPAAANALPPVRLPDPASRVPTGSAASASGAPSPVAALPPASPHELPPAVKPPVVSAVRQASSEVDEGRSSDASSRKLGQRRPGSGLTRPPLPQQPDTQHTSAGRQAAHVGRNQRHRQRRKLRAAEAAAAVAAGGASKLQTAAAGGDTLHAPSGAAGIASPVETSTCAGTTSGAVQLPYACHLSAACAFPSGLCFRHRPSRLQEAFWTHAAYAQRGWLRHLPSGNGCQRLLIGATDASSPAPSSAYHVADGTGIVYNVTVQIAHGPRHCCLGFCRSRQQMEQRFRRPWRRRRRRRRH